MVDTIRTKFEKMTYELEKPDNYRKFFYSREQNMFGFGTFDQIALAKNTIHNFRAMRRRSTRH